MATLQGMSGIDVTAFVDEMNEMLPLWIGKIYQFDATHCGIRLGGKEHIKHLLLLEMGRRIHMVPAFPPAPQNPTGFAMLLRKYLEGGKILSVGQYGIQRVLYLEIGKRNLVFRLCIELFDEGNVILCQADGVIIMPLRQHRFREREVVKGAVYTPGGSDCSTFSEKDLELQLMGNEKELVKFLAVDCLLGGQYAEEVCRMANISKRTPASQVSGHIIKSVINSLLERVRHYRTPVISPSGCWPIILGSETPLHMYPSFSNALTEFYQEPLSERSAPPDRASHVRSIREQQQRMITQSEEKIGSIQRKVESIYSHYIQIDELQKILREARKRFSWQEIETRIREGKSDEARMVTKVDPLKSAIDLDIGERVTIYIDDSIDANVVRYYEQIKKLKRKKDGALKALDTPLKKREGQKQTIRTQKKRWFHRFRWFHTSDGILVVGGKDAAQNEELVKRYMEGKDIFFHADIHGASVVLVKGTTIHPLEAAQFAASYSGAWKSGRVSADVYSVRPDQVSKTPPSGEYVARGSFMIRGERTYYRDTSLAVAIGICMTDDMSVIGGPLSAIIPRVSVYVTLHPGQFESNDMAKKVVRILKDRLETKGIRGLRRILTTDAVTPFIPSGGSDLGEEDES